MPKKLNSGRSSRRKRPASLRAGDLSLDPEARVVMLNGDPRRLRPKECKLLEILMLHQGETLSRAFLMNKVWETEYVEDTRTLEVHVSFLRKRIEDDARNSVYLHTVRGVGYRFEYKGGIEPAG